MTGPRMEPPMFMAWVMIGRIESVTLTGGLLFPSESTNDETLGVEVALEVAVGVREARAVDTGVELAAAVTLVGAGVGEAVALGGSVGVEVAVRVE